MNKLKNIVIGVWILILAAMFATQGNATAGDKETSPKDLYKTSCRVCHEKDSPNGEYSPMSLTSDQWKAFFKNKFADKHKDVVLEKEKKKLVEFLTTKQIETLQKYCVDHAADSEQPQTCSE